MICIGLACLIAVAAPGVQGAADNCYPQLLESTIRQVHVLDPKTKIPYEMRDRTDRNYFHGAEILSSPTPSAKLNDLWSEVRKSEAACRELKIVVPDLGLRLRVGESDKDFLLCVAACETPYLVEAGTLAAWPLAAATAKALSDELRHLGE